MPPSLHRLLSNRTRLGLLKPIGLLAALLLVAPVSLATSSALQQSPAANPSLNQASLPSLQLSFSAGNYLQLSSQPLIRALYKRIGYHVEFVPLPGRRSLSSSNLGITDGEVARIDAKGQGLTNLIALPTPLFHFEGRIYSLADTPVVKSWEELLQHPTAIRRGVIWEEQGVAANDSQVVRLTNLDQALRMLISGRVQYALANEPAAQALIERSYHDQAIVAQPHALGSYSIYHWVHRRHAALVPQLDAALQSLKGSQELAQLLAFPRASMPLASALYAPYGSTNLSAPNLAPQRLANHSN